MQSQGRVSLLRGVGGGKWGVSLLKEVAAACYRRSYWGKVSPIKGVAVFKGKVFLL